MSYFDNDKFRQATFLVILTLLGVLLFLQLQTFVPAFLGALTLYVLMRKWMFRMVYVRKWKPSRAALVFMLTSFIIIMLPIWLVINLLSGKVTTAIEHFSELTNSFNGVVGQVEKKIGFKVISSDNLKAVSAFIALKIPTVLGATFSTLADIAMMYFMLYFMLINGRSMEKAIGSFIPMSEENVNKVGREVNNMVASNAIGIPLIAALQGVVGLVGYIILGVDEPLFWFAITTVTAMLPVVGAALAYVPLGLIFFAQGHNWRGIMMLVYGFGVIGTVDNIFRFTLQKKIGDTHPLVTILGVLAGLSLFGFIGLIFGPLLISLFLLLIKIYLREFVEKNTPRSVN